MVVMVMVVAVQRLVFGVTWMPDLPVCCDSRQVWLAVGFLPPEVNDMLSSRLYQRTTVHS